MSKRQHRLGNDDPAQMSLLAFLQQAQALRETPPSEGAFEVSTRLAHSLSNAIRTCGLSRWEVAGKMSHLLGREITKFMLDAWTAESKEGHRMPAEFLPAFCVATGSREPLQLLADAAGLFCLPGPDALRAEIQKLNEEERRVKAERRKREVFLQEMEGR